MAKHIPVIQDEKQRQASILDFSSISDSLEIWQQLTDNNYSKNTLLAFKKF